MRVWLYRWPNGDCSVVWARNRLDALDVLDEEGAAVMRNLIPLPPGRVSLRLEDDGELGLEGFGEYMTEIVDQQYPYLEAVRMRENEESVTPEEWAEAVKKERERVRDEIEEAGTPEGRRIQKSMGMAGPLADRYVLEGHKGPLQ